MYAVRRSGPPKQMLVVMGSPVATWDSSLPSGLMTEMQPVFRVATQTLPEETVEALIAGQAADEPAAMWHQARPPPRDARRDEVEGPEPAGVGFRDIDGRAVGRQAD